MAVERTLSIIKPDAVAANVIGQIYAVSRPTGSRSSRAQMRWLSLPRPAVFTPCTANARFQDLVDFTTSGPVMIQVLEGDNAIAKNRDLMGATDPKKRRARHRSRADFAKSIDANAGRMGPTARNRRARKSAISSRHWRSSTAEFARDQPARSRRRWASRLFRRSGREAVSREAGVALGASAAAATTSRR